MTRTRSTKKKGSSNVPFDVIALPEVEEEACDNPICWATMASRMITVVKMIPGGQRDELGIMALIFN